MPNTIRIPKYVQAIDTNYKVNKWGVPSSDPTCAYYTRILKDWTMLTGWQIWRWQIFICKIQIFIRNVILLKL